MNVITQFFVPIIVVFVVLALLVSMALFSRNYLKTATALGGTFR